MKINFTEEMIKIIKDTYPTKGINQTLIELGLDESSKYEVQHKAQALKLKRTNKYFTDEEIDYLKNNYGVISTDEIVEVLKRSRDTILHKACELGLRNDKYFYSEEDINYLKDNYGTISVSDIAKYLNKTYSSILTKANKLNLVSSEKWSPRELKLLFEIYPYYSNKELAKYYFKNRKPETIRAIALKNGLHKIKGKKVFNKEIAFKEFKAVCDKINRAPLQSELKDYGLPSGATYASLFGTYTNVCIETGYAPNSAIFGKSIRLKSSDGHKCFSKSEYQICEYLIKHNIKYGKEIPYKNYMDESKCGNKRVDWVIDGCFVEFFGMPEKQSYKQRIEEKRQLCKDNNIKLIELYKKDLKNLDDKLHIFHSKNP